MIALLLLLPSLVFCNKTVDFLSRFGYLDEGALVVDGNIESALKLFQETFGLNVTGTLTDETIKLMNTPRCGNKDEILPFSANPQKRWPNRTLTWYMYGGQQYHSLIQRAFDVWANHTNLYFRREAKDPNIIMSFSEKQHVLYFRKDMCPSEFDGPGVVLAHAYPYDRYHNQTDIHFDKEEKWDFTMNIPENGHISFYLVVIHEIGHVLGLSHSYANHSIMAPSYSIPPGITNLYEFDLSRDDIHAIQFMYGAHVVTTTTTPTTTTTTTVSTTTLATSTEPVPLPVLDMSICGFRHQIDTFVVINKKLFAFFGEFVWIMNLEPELRTPTEYTHPKKISDWLTFLPQEAFSVSAVYQRADGSVAMFINNKVYIVEYPSLRLIRNYTIEEVVGRKVRNVNSAFMSNQGKTYILIDDWYTVEIDECKYRGKLAGITTNILHGVPGDIQGAFKYINGRIYFLTASKALEYNEFTNTVTRSDSDVFDVLQINCVRETLLRRLYEILRYIQ